MCWSWDKANVQNARVTWNYIQMVRPSIVIFAVTGQKPVLQGSIQ